MHNYIVFVILFNIFEDLVHEFFFSPFFSLYNLPHRRRDTTLGNYGCACTELCRFSGHFHAYTSYIPCMWVTVSGLYRLRIQPRLAAHGHGQARSLTEATASQKFRPPAEFAKEICVSLMLYRVPVILPHNGARADGLEIIEVMFLNVLSNSNFAKGGNLRF